MAVPVSYNGPQPPDLPNIPDAGPALTSYLRNFALWAKNGLSGKLDANSSAPAHLLQGHDAPPRTAPNVFKFQVSQDGIASLAPVALGSPPSASTGVPIFPEAPSDGSSYVRQDGAWVAATPPFSGGTVSALTFSPLPVDAANDAAAATAGVPIGGVYKNGSVLMVRVT